MTWLIPFSELTPEQQDAATLDTDSNKAIVGGPGAGKTMVLLHRLDHLYRAAGGNEKAVHLFVYTTTLKDYIRAAVDLLRIPQECITTFDSWCIEVYRTSVSRTLPQSSACRFRKPDFDAIRVSVLNLCRTRPSTLPRFKFALIHEAQDMDATALEIVRTLADHVTAAMDGKQQLYDGRLGEAEVLELLDLRRVNRALLPAYRCNPMVTNLAAHFIRDGARRAEFLRQGRNAQGDRFKPLLYLASDHDDEKRKLAELIRVRLSDGNSIGILFPQRRMVWGYSKGLEELGIDVVKDSRAGIDFADRRPKVLSYHEAKGLTFDVVFMPRLDTAAFQNALATRAAELLFVGASRATSWVCLSGREEKLLPEVRAFLNDQTAAGHLEIQTSPVVASQRDAENDDAWLDEVDVV